MGFGFLKYLNPVGGVLSAISDTKAKNRGEKFGGQMDLERLLMDREQGYQDMRISREQEGRAGSSDAWRKLLAAQHTLSPGARPQLAGPYSIAPRQATEAETTGADALTREVMTRLQGGNPIPGVTERPLEVDRRLMDPSKGESILGWLGAILGGVGRAADQSQSSQR